MKDYELKILKGTFELIKQSMTSRVQDVLQFVFDKASETNKFPSPKEIADGVGIEEAEARQAVMKGMSILKNRIACLVTMVPDRYPSGKKVEVSPDPTALLKQLEGEGRTAS